MTITSDIVNQFATKVDTEKQYSRAELDKILTEVYQEITSYNLFVLKIPYSNTKSFALDKKKKTKKEKTENNEPKKKREPTVYNIFVKEQMPIIKDEFQDLSQQDLMRKIGEMWKTSKILTRESHNE